MCRFQPNPTHISALSFTCPTYPHQVLRALHPGGMFLQIPRCFRCMKEYAPLPLGLTLRAAAATRFRTMTTSEHTRNTSNVVFLSCLRRALIRYTAGSSFRRHRCDGYSMFRWRFIVVIPIRRFMLLLQCVHRWNLFRCQATQVTCSNSNGPDERHAQNLKHYEWHASLRSFEVDIMRTTRNFQFLMETTQDM